MKFSTCGLWTSLAASVLAEDLLFVDTFEYQEFKEATTTLGYTTKVVTKAQWKLMTTADFAAFKAIVIADPDCSTNPSDVQFLTDTKNTWGPAVQGNIVVIGTDPTYHFSSQPGAKVLVDNSIKFAASGVSTTGTSQTGLYYALSCYYNSVESATIESLSYFGDFGVRGNLACYNKVHIVASSPALGTLDDAALSSWSCSVHEAFSHYPSVGVNGFQALAIAQDVIGDGSQTFGDKTIGLPYIISRGATPAGCGNGIWEPSVGEECDDNNKVSGDGCSASCKCESGRSTGDGHCLPPIVVDNSTSSTYHPSTSRSSNSSTIYSSTLHPSTSLSSNSSIVHSSTSRPSSSASISYSPSSSGESSGVYGNKTVTATATVHDTATIHGTATIHDTATVHDTKTVHDITTTTFTPPPYKTPACPTSDKIVGVEIIIHVSIIESCTTIGASTQTSYITSECSTEHRPIWSTSSVGYPCYACALSSAGVPCPTGGFITATTTSCLPSTPTSYTWTPSPPTVLPCKTCIPYTLSTCPAYSTFPLSSIYIVPAPTYGTHAEGSHIPEPSIYVPAASPTTIVKTLPGGYSTTIVSYPAGPTATVVVSTLVGGGVTTIVTYAPPPAPPTPSAAKSSTLVPVCPGGCSKTTPAPPAGTSSVLGYSTYIPFTGDAVMARGSKGVAIMAGAVGAVFGLMIML
ncbi:hypothetical protein CJF32_00005304 [Rutstroemia sp. NJR-2017a WRK4]|nr:hypothetical protein CJF32_00005304 [Rutstroemia sp. NJR-2017a WRK4]